MHLSAFDLISFEDPITINDFIFACHLFPSFLRSNLRLHRDEIDFDLSPVVDAVFNLFEVL